ncbi:MAG: 4'-phosphopantetheinyl transferase superfamily protein [Lachnospiraceae bacterium]|nr:4'-phosphopantetheinyl transferase superfamily protein [Lachnospiraceae bacterium]
MHKVKVYILDTDGLDYESLYDRFFYLIESDRRDRIVKCASRGSKAMLLYTGAMLSKVLDGYGVTSSDIDRDEHGKPFIKGRNDLFINLSHSGNLITLAVSDAPVGVDVQKPVKAKDSLIDRIASKEEREECGKLIEDRFNLFWAVKESYAKLTGEGIGLDFKKIKMSIKGEAPEEHEIFEIIPTDGTLNDRPAYGNAFYICDTFPCVVTMFEEFTIEQEMLVL